MTTRCWLGLLVLLLAPTAQALRAQTPDRPSHRPIDNGLDNESSPEKRLAERLRKPRADKGVQEQAKFDDDFRELAKKLLADPQLRESLLKNIRKEDVDHLKRTLNANRDLANDPALQKLVADGLTNQKLSDHEKELVQRWKDKVGHAPDRNNPLQNKTPNNPQTKPQPTANPKNAKTPTGSESLPRETPDWVKNGLTNGTRDLSKWLDSPAGKSFRDGLKDLGKRAGDTKNSPVGERADKVTRNLPKPGKWLTDNVKPRPAPRMDAQLPSSPSLARVSAGDALRFLVIALTVVFLLVLAWKSRGIWKDIVALGRATGWRLGPWPVRPGAVATRSDLVRAFEYLALLRLGQPARTHHHLDLAKLIGEQASANPDRRRDAAGTLSRLYEQARYTPDDEPLSPTDVEAARRELSFLAGGAAA